MLDMAKFTIIWYSGTRVETKAKELIVATQRYM